MFEEILLLWGKHLPSSSTRLSPGSTLSNSCSAISFPKGSMDFLSKFNFRRNINCVLSS